MVGIQQPTYGAILLHRECALPESFTRVTRIEKRTIDMATAGAGAETTQNEIGSDETRLVSADEGKHDEV